MTVMPLGWDQDCNLKNRELDVPAPWFLDPGGWSKTATVKLYFIFPGICTLSLKLLSFKKSHLLIISLSVCDTEEWIRKMWYMYTMEYYAAEKNNDIMKFAGKWMDLENIILSE
ncbi:hypothetical protein STEG23_003710, partial [Scotinomys teguina]